MILSDPQGTSTRNTMATRTLSQSRRAVTDRLAQPPDNISNSLVSPRVRNKCDSDLLHWIFPNCILLYFLQNSIDMAWEILDDSRKETRIYFLVLFIFENSFFGQSMKSNENNLYYLPCSIENLMPQKILSGKTGFNPGKM